MNPSLQVIFRNIAPSESIKENIKDRLESFEKYCDKITNCRVVIEQRNRRHRQGNLFQVGVNIKVPDAELVVSHHPDEDHRHEDVYVAITDAFDAIQRQLEHYAQLRQA